MIALFALALAATTGTAPRPNPAVSPAAYVASACAVLTRTEVESVLGVKLIASKEESARDSSTCDYSARNRLVSVTVQRFPADVDMAEAAQALERALPGTTIRHTTGFGIRAFFLDVGDSGTQLHILRSNRDHLMITVLGFGAPPAVSGAAQKLARTALGRLSGTPER